MMQVKFTILKYTWVYLIVYYLITIIIFIWYMLHFGDIYLCDEGFSSGRSYEWGNEWTNNDSEDRYKENKYQPYRPGLQPTTEGYRYEADGREVNYESTSEGYRYEADGRPVDNHLYSYDSTRNVDLNQMYSGNGDVNNLNTNKMYGNTNESNSTKLGFEGGSSTQTMIHQYAKDNGYNKDIYKCSSNKRPSLLKIAVNFVKEDFKATREGIAREKWDENREWLNQHDIFRRQIKKEQQWASRPDVHLSSANKRYMSRRLYDFQQADKYRLKIEGKYKINNISSSKKVYY